MAAAPAVSAKELVHIHAHAVEATLETLSRACDHCRKSMMGARFRCVLHADHPGCSYVICKLCHDKYVDKKPHLFVHAEHRHKLRLAPHDARYNWFCNIAAKLGVVCQKRASQPVVGTPTRLTCATGCDYDICGSCLAASGRVVAGHEHALVQCFVGQNWRCDVCGTGALADVASHRCAAMCDFDMCDGCWRMCTEHAQPPLRPRPSQLLPPRRPAPAASIFVPARRKRALIIGINYERSKYLLKGCVNDAHAIKRLLETQFGYPVDGMRLLLEGERTDQPTYENIIKGLDWLASDVQSGDYLFLHYSGHGTQVKDQGGDECDGMDEAILPMDWASCGFIRDDDIYARLVKKLPAGACVHALIDACHSGSMLDLLHTWSAGGKTWDRADCGEDRSTRGLAISFSGCADDQTSADTNAYAKRFTTGAMSFLFALACRHRLADSYDDLLRHVNEALAGQPRPELARAIETEQQFTQAAAASAPRGLGDAMGHLTVDPPATAAAAVAVAPPGSPAAARPKTPLQRHGGVRGRPEYVAGLSDYLAQSEFGQTLALTSSLTAAAVDLDQEIRLRALPQFRQRAQLCASGPFPASLPLNF